MNPRLQVEHTITESILNTDIVKAQLLLAQGAPLNECNFPNSPRDPQSPPSSCSIQLRITSENVQNNWSLSIGKITSFHFPNGNGVRVDTHLVNSHATIVSTDFDSLLAKLVITASTWKDAVRKAQRALDDTKISGVRTNLDMLRTVVAYPDFLDGHFDTQWLERKQEELLYTTERISTWQLTQTTHGTTERSFLSSSIGLGNALFRKGDA